ncbi:hypothetical protein HRbin36_00170 [bacterium HR36]|nr:hypothetical protein HRbin36_00170 [bacterium HR36]
MSGTSWSVVWRLSGVALAVLLSGCGGGSVQSEHLQSGKTERPASGLHRWHGEGRDEFKSEVGGKPSEPLRLITHTPAPGSKIIYHATVQLSVANLDTFADSLDRLVNQYEGYVAMREISGTVETSREGRWRLRVPAGSLQSFLTELLRLGEVIHTQLESQDVTEQYYDLESRLKVAQAEEKRLLQLLDAATGKLSDILAVEKELNRVRIDIERMTGQLRRLGNLVEYSTVTLSVTERQRYYPETTPDLWTRMKRASEDSWLAMKGAGEEMLVFSAAALPWLPPVLVLAAVLWLAGRWVIRRLVRWLTSLVSTRMRQEA